MNTLNQASPERRYYWSRFRKAMTDLALCCCAGTPVVWSYAYHVYASNIRLYDTREFWTIIWDIVR